MKCNTIACGDNLDVLRSTFEDESVDLVYLDPPFNSGGRYDLLRDGPSAAGTRAFEDTWAWDEGQERLWTATGRSLGEPLEHALGAFRTLLGPSPMLAYLLMLAPRLVELHRVLKPAGSIYVHCDGTAVHVIKLFMDALFGPGNFLNHIVWLYGLGGSSKRYWPRKHDDLLWYSKTAGGHHFEPVMIPATSQRMKGQSKKAPDYWDIPSLNNMAKERVGYPTQKPEALLERVIRSSSRPDDLVLDPFCGSGTTLVAAHTLARRWFGIDVSPLAVEVATDRLRERGAPLDPAPESIGS